MEKSDIIFWRSLVAGLVFLEVCADLLLNQNPIRWTIVRLVFTVINAGIIMHLLSLRNKTEKLKTQKA
jgi:hypothetical protein